MGRGTSCGLLRLLARGLHVFIISADGREWTKENHRDIQRVIGLSRFHCRYPDFLLSCNMRFIRALGGCLGRCPPHHWKVRDQEACSRLFNIREAQLQALCSLVLLHFTLCFLPLLDMPVPVYHRALAHAVCHMESFMSDSGHTLFLKNEH